MPKKKVAERKHTPMSDAHKQALAEGRVQANAVKRYLEAIAASAPKRRGRQPIITPERLAAVEAKIANATSPIEKLELTQQKLDLERALAAKTEVVDITELEQAFVKVAAPYAASKGISAAAFRALGVPAEVLKRAGIK